jgi:hypothetical protein
LTDPAGIIAEAFAFADTLICNNGAINLRSAVSVRGEGSVFKRYAPW